MKLPNVFGFSKRETVAILTILAVLIVALSVNLKIAVRKRRDAQRKSDIREIQVALGKYYDDFGFVPLSSENGEIKACLPKEGPVKDEKGSPIFVACKWGLDKLADQGDPNYPAYMEKLPRDPSAGQGFEYFYLSNGKDFQLFAALEGKSEAEYDPKIEARGIVCGTKLCNFGLASFDLPLDKTLEEYENKLDE